MDVSQLENDGWSSLVKLEIQMLRELVTDHSPKTALQCHRAKLAVEAENSVSMRLRSLLQGTGLGRSLWGALKDAADNAISPTSLTNEVKERAAAIANTNLGQLLQQPASAHALWDVIVNHPTLVPAVMKTREALSQLPGSTDITCQQETDLLQKTMTDISVLVAAQSSEAMRLLSDLLQNFWKSDMSNPERFKHIDVFVHVLIACKAPVQCG